MHLLHCDYPTFDEVSQSASQGHVTTVAVELLAIDGLTRVMGGDHVAGRGSRTRVVSLGQHLVENALGQCLYTVFL